MSDERLNNKLVAMYGCHRCKNLDCICELSPPKNMGVSAGFDKTDIHLSKSQVDSYYKNLYDSLQSENNGLQNLIHNLDRYMSNLINEQNQLKEILAKKDSACCSLQRKLAKAVEQRDAFVSTYDAKPTEMIASFNKEIAEISAENKK